MDMEYTWEDQDIVKTTKDLRHETEPETYIPKDTIIKIIGIGQNRGYRITTVGNEIEIDGIMSNEAFQKLTEFEEELILEYDFEYANELIRDRHVEIKTHQNLNYIEFNDLRVNSHCSKCDSFYKWKSDYFMPGDEKPRKIRDSYGHYLICECKGRWIPTKRDININMGSETYLRNYTEPSRSVAAPLGPDAVWLIHIKEPNNTNGKRSWWGIHYLREYLEDNQKLKAENKIAEIYILYNDFIRLKRNSGGIYALRTDKNRSRQRFGGDGLRMSTYQIQMNSSPSFWSQYLALLISESALCITRNGCIWKDVLPNKNLKKELDDKAEALITYRDKVLAHADSEIYARSGVDDFLTRRLAPQANKELLDDLLKESHKLYGEGLQEINKKFDLDIEPEIYSERNRIRNSIEPIREGILTAPTDLLKILRMVEESIMITNLKAEDVVNMLSSEEIARLEGILNKT